jgi:hypothetical protein
MPFSAGLARRQDRFGAEDVHSKHLLDPHVRLSAHEELMIARARWHLAHVAS